MGQDWPHPAIMILWQYSLSDDDGRFDGKGLVFRSEPLYGSHGKAKQAPTDLDRFPSVASGATGASSFCQAF
jgi:hypothetical protein